MVVYLGYPSVSLYEYLQQSSENRRMSIAIEDRDERFTYQDIIDRSNRLADFLITCDVKKNDTIAIAIPNSIDFVFSVFSVFQIGAKVTPINTRLSQREINFQLLDSEAKAIIISPEMCDVFGDLKNKFDFKARIITPSIVSDSSENDCINDYVHLKSILQNDRNFTENKSKADSIAFLLYTGGTTGTPKAVMLTHSNILINSMQFNNRLDESPRTDKESALAVLPLSHSFGLICALFAPLFRGDKIITQATFSPSKVLEIIEKKKITAFHGVPTMYYALLNEDLEKYDISSLKLCISGGAGLPKEVYEQFLRRTGVSIKEGYGLTECSPVTHVNPIYDPKIGSIGKLLTDTQAKIIDLETNETMELGEVGEMVIKGPQVMKGYWKKGVETINVFTKDGWLKTGDLAKVDEKEYFYIVDRLKEVINSGGYKIYPREVEEILHQHPAVAIAAVIPKPDDFYGEVVKAYIVLKKGQETSKEEITEYCRKILASYKIPKEIEFTKQLPLSAAGKVLKRKLKKNNTT